MPSIIVTNVSFSYGSHLVLDRVSLQVGAGERAFGLKDEKSWSEPDLSALWCGKVWFKVVGGQL